MVLRLSQAELVPHQHQSLLDRRPQPPKLAVLFHELHGVRRVRKHLYSLRVVGRGFDPLGGAGRGIVPVHLYVLLSLKDDISDVPDATKLETPGEVLTILPLPLFTTSRRRLIVRPSP